MGKGRTAPHLHVGVPGNETRALLLLVTWTQFNDSNCLFFLKSGAINTQIIHRLESTFTASKELR